MGTRVEVGTTYNGSMKEDRELLEAITKYEDAKHRRTTVSGLFVLFALIGTVYPIMIAWWDESRLTDAYMLVTDSWLFWFMGVAIILSAVGRSDLLEKFLGRFNADKKDDDDDTTDGQAQ